MQHFRINRKIHKYFKDNFLNCKKLCMPSLNKPAYVWPTQSTQGVKIVVYLRKRSHNRLLPRFCNKLRNTCRRSLSQRLVSWSSPMVPEVWIKTRRRVENGQKMRRAEAIRTGVVDFERYHYVSVSVLLTIVLMPSHPNPAFVQIILSVSKHYPKV